MKQLPLELLMIEIEKVQETQRAWQAISPDDESAIQKMADKSLTGCAEAVVVLIENLKKIGYVWANSEQLKVDTIENNIQTLEKTMEMPVPQILVRFWKIIGGISLIDLDRYQHVEFWKEHKIAGPKYFCDGLYVDSCCDGWTASVCDDFVDWRDNSTPGGSEEFLLSLSPDGYHKDNTSGGSPYGIFPGNSWKPIWQYFEWSGVERPLSAPEGSTDFLSYLRTTILECAGFPAFFGVPGFDPIKERILRGVPIF